ncbi:hypothetical protein K466DRAFT_667394 [Polyporus arcularius HHB13444]|uniref:Heterokaryon incompatibility domain-containing protein n=1 Tax=Polyporus arcularius HHB13444 TaxID=1314778 RepID=A0A5C3NW25_9APHY|nr:hypothetical protein K466DRAFT_667394 [Polyporus arcularius HHB13444]
MAESCLIDIAMRDHRTTITHPPSLPLPDHDSLFFVDCHAFLDPLSPRLIVRPLASPHPPAYSVVSHPGLAVIAEWDGPAPDSLRDESVWVDIPRFGRVVISLALLRIACRLSMDRGCKQLWIDVLCMHQEWHAKNAEAQEHYSLRRHNIYWDAQLCLIFPGGLRRLSSIDEITQYCRNDHFLVETRLTHPRPMRPVLVVLRWDPEALGFEHSSSESWTLVVNSLRVTDDMAGCEEIQGQGVASTDDYILLPFDMLLHGSIRGMSLCPGQPFRNQHSHRLNSLVFGDVEQVRHRDLLESLWQAYRTHSKQKAIESAFEKALLFGYSSISSFAADVYAAIIGVDSPSEPLPSWYAPKRAASAETIWHLFQSLSPWNPPLDLFRHVAVALFPYPRRTWPWFLMEPLDWHNIRTLLASNLPKTPPDGLWYFEPYALQLESDGADERSTSETTLQWDVIPAGSPGVLFKFGEWVYMHLNDSTAVYRRPVIPLVVTFKRLRHDGLFFHPPPMSPPSNHLPYRK